MEEGGCDLQTAGEARHWPIHGAGTFDGSFVRRYSVGSRLPPTPEQEYASRTSLTERLHRARQQLTGARVAFSVHYYAIFAILHPTHSVRLCYRPRRSRLDPRGRESWVCDAVGVVTGEPCAHSIRPFKEEVKKEEEEKKPKLRRGNGFEAEGDILEGEPSTHRAHTSDTPTIRHHLCRSFAGARESTNERCFLPIERVLGGCVHVTRATFRGWSRR